MPKFSDRPALLILDVQNGFDDPYWGSRNNPDAENQIVRLLKEWRNQGWPIAYSQHLSMDPNSPFHYKNQLQVDIKETVKPLDGETVMQKHVNSAFIGTQLETYLKDQKVKRVVITGLSTQHCVSTTTRMSGNLGFDTFLISDATAAFDITDHNGKHFTAEQVHESELATLHKEFATILDTETLLQSIKP